MGPAALHDAPDLPQPFPHPATLDLRAAPDLTSSLLAQRGADLVLDGSGVRHLGGQCPQVLLSAQRTWTTDGRTFRLAAASQELQSGAALLGAAALLEHDRVRLLNLGDGMLAKTMTWSVIGSST